MNDQALEAAMYPNQAQVAPAKKVKPDFISMHKEHKLKSVTKQLRWEEYQQTHGDNTYPYSQYCQHYRDWAGRL